MMSIERIERLEALIAQAGNKANQGVTSTTQGVLRDVPNDNVARVVLSMPVTSPHPIFIDMFFMAKDDTSNRSMWSRFRVTINGNAVTPVLVSSGNEFQTIQPGFANPPSFTIALSGDGLSVEGRCQNPVLGNATGVDVEVTFTMQISAAG